MRIGQARLTTLGFGVALAILIAVGLESHGSAKAVVDAARRARHTQEVLDRVNDTRYPLGDAAAAHAAFVDSGKAEWLGRYQQALKATAGHLDAIRALTVDNVSQQRRLVSTAGLLEERRMVLQRAREALAKGMPADARALVSRVGRQDWDEVLRQALRDVQAEENRLQNGRLVRVQADAGRAVTNVLWGTVLASLLVGAAMMLLQRDLRRRERAERRLRRTSDWLTAIKDNLQAGVLVLDAQRQIELVNRELLTLFGLDGSLEAWRGRPWDELLPELLKAIAEGDRAGGFLPAMLNTRALATQREVRLTTGQVLELEYVPIAVDGDAGHMLVFREITGRREAERLTINALRQAQAATKAKSEFLATMSHELRTPLNSVIGFSEMLEDEVAGPLSDEQRDFVQTIHRNGAHLLVLINEILDLAKVEAGKLTLNRQPLDLAAVTADVVQIMRPQALSKQIDIAVQADSPAVWIEADPLRVRQVITNLLTNAVKFSPEGTVVHLEITTSADQARLLVRDQGIGIAAEDHERVFQEFVQIDGGHARRQEGTGLGLPLARRLIELQGGRLWLESALGQGSTFGFALPLLVTASGVPEAAGRPDRPTVLLIDDGTGAVMALGETLAAFGARLLHAAGDSDVLDAAERARPALILVSGDGAAGDWRTLAALRSEPSLAATPVIVLGAAEQAPVGLSLGDHDYIVEPLDRDRLQTIAAHYLNQAATRVLVVDDDADFGRYLRAVLRPWRVEVQTATDGQQALDRIATYRPDLVLLDLAMPQMDGWTLLPLLDPHLPVIVITNLDLGREELALLEGRVLAVWQKGGLKRRSLLGEIQAAYGQGEASP